MLFSRTSISVYIIIILSHYRLLSSFSFNFYSYCHHSSSSTSNGCMTKQTSLCIIYFHYLYFCLISFLHTPRHQSYTCLQPSQYWFRCWYLVLYILAHSRFIVIMDPMTHGCLAATFFLSIGTHIIMRGYVECTHRSYVFSLSLCKWKELAHVIENLKEWTGQFMKETPINDGLWAWLNFSCYFFFQIKEVMAYKNWLLNVVRNFEFFLSLTLSSFQSSDF